jgi:hypothetical protein
MFTTEPDAPGSGPCKRALQLMDPQNSENLLTNWATVSFPIRSRKESYILWYTLTPQRPSSYHVTYVILALWAEVLIAPTWSYVNFYATGCSIESTLVTWEIISEDREQIFTLRQGLEPRTPVFECSCFCASLFLPNVTLNPTVHMIPWKCDRRSVGQEGSEGLLQCLPKRAIGLSFDPLECILQHLTFSF